MADSVTFLLLGVSIGLNAVCIWLLVNQKQVMGDAADVIEDNNAAILERIRLSRLDTGIIATRRIDGYDADR